MTTELLAPMVQRSTPLMQFSARVDGSSAYVRIQPSRLEWSLVGREWVIVMAPIASVTAVASEPGSLKSSLVVTTNVGTVEFRIQPETCETARTLLLRLVAESAADPVVAEPEAADPGSASELINLRWMFDADAVDDLDHDGGRAHLMAL
jgi:hypothetical protein